MADIYFIYASEDRNVVLMLDELLSERWETWWDDKIVGRYDVAIEKEVPEAKLVVALLSEYSKKKDTFWDELIFCRDQGRPIIIVSLDETRPRYPFHGSSRTDMPSWNGEIDHAGYNQLLRRLASIVPPREPPSRPPKIVDSKLSLPKLFYSVSSYNTSIKPSDAVKALRILKASSILVSAYDLVVHPNRTRNNDVAEVKRMIRELKSYQENGGFILVDSGNYEATRLEDDAWGVKKFKEAIASAPHDYVLSLDEMNPSIGKYRAVEQVVEAVKRDRGFTSAPVIPIVHAYQLKEGGYKLEHLPYIVREVSERLQPPLIAIPERELGGGIIDRAKTLCAIRIELSKLPYYQPLHILGTGHPWAVAILTAAGADTFDGLEWCRYTFFDESESEGISHFHLFDVIGESDESDMGYAAKVAFHNLQYLESFETVMQKMVMNNEEKLWVQGLLRKRPFSKLIERCPELFE
jgi:hypothetical protein